MGDKAAVGVVDYMAEGMQCMDHPYRSNQGGVCALCLREKLFKLVSSSKSTPFFSLHPPPLSSSSSSPTSFISDAGVTLGLASGHSDAGAGRRYGFPFLGATHIKKRKSGGAVASGYGNGGRKVMAAVATKANFTPAAVAKGSGIVLKRSKSVAPKTAAGGGAGVGDFGVAESPRKKSFWSFLYLSAASSTTTSSSAAINSSSNINRRRSTSSSSVITGHRDISYNKQQHPGVHDAAGGVSGQAEAESPSGSQASSSFGRKVGRSRSVGCGSRSFSGDFLERISTGFGDCTLRRVESHRESKSKIVLHLDASDEPRPTMKERVKCGALFGAFGMPSSAYAAEEGFDSSVSSRMSSSAGVHGGRSRSWSWAFASPMRAFTFRPHSTSSSAPATNDIISSINASNKMANGGGGSKVSKVDGHPSILTVKS